VVVASLESKPAKDAGTLLDADEELVKAAASRGVMELTRALTPRGGWSVTVEKKASGPARCRFGVPVYDYITTV